MTAFNFCNTLAFLIIFNNLVMYKIARASKSLVESPEQLGFHAG